MKPLPEIKKCSLVKGKPKCNARQAKIFDGDCAIYYRIEQVDKDRIGVYGHWRRTERAAINIWNRKVK